MIFVAILVSMADPITAGGGLLTGILWWKRSAWALLPFFTAFVVIAGLQIVSANPRVYYIVVQTLAVAVWTALIYLVPRLWSKRPETTTK